MPVNNDNLNGVSEKRIAILIDGDNAQASLLEQIVVESSRFGSSTIRRIYGDWTSTNMKSWKDPLNSYAFQPFQQFSYSVGKNSTDSAMIIDAMDILHANQVDGFCLVSSDSDYTRLATRLRESGKLVVGIGKSLTPVHLFLLVMSSSILKIWNNASVKESRRCQTGDEQEEQTLIDNIEDAIEMAGTDDDGWARLSEVGTALRRIDPGFDPRSYGSRQLAPYPFP